MYKSKKSSSVIQTFLFDLQEGKATWLCSGLWKQETSPNVHQQLTKRKWHLARASFEILADLFTGDEVREGKFFKKARAINIKKKEIKRIISLHQNDLKLYTTTV